jgi:phosphoribosylamine--glycine ligase
MKILVLGSGAREHALAQSLAASAGEPEVLVAPGNDGMRDVARPVAVPLGDVEALADLAQREGVALTIAGSEEPLVRGAWDAFDGRGLRLFGPSAAAARLEGSKAFAKDFMQRHAIPTAAYDICADIASARAALRRRGFPLVIKADGLAAGKGVHVVGGAAEAEASLQAMLEAGRYGEAGRVVVIEEALAGPEISVFAVSDGYTWRLLGVARDHKRVHDGDRGPNTGGMGAYAPVPEIGPELVADIEARILAPTLVGLLDEGVPYRGFLYLGLMLTARGPRLLEYNCRLGDPEAQVLLPRLRGDFLQLVRAADAGDLAAAELEIGPEAAVGVVLASEGYPEAPRTGRSLRGLEAARQAGARVYCAGVRQEDGGLVTSGGRICTVVGSGRDLTAARDLAYAAVQRLEVEGAFYRRDIAAASLEGRAWPDRVSAS